MSTFGDLFKKAHGAIASLRGGNNVFLGKDGEIVYSKNNVCVHETSDTSVGELDEDNVVHTPGYLTIHCVNDDAIGVSLVLQWLPNATLEKNPSSIRCVSPRGRSKRSDARDPNAAETSAQNHNSRSNSVTTEIKEVTVETTVKEPAVQINGNSIPQLMMTNDRPQTLQTTTLDSGGLSVPSINVIPNTPVDPRKLLDDYDENVVTKTNVKEVESNVMDNDSQSSGETSGADEQSDKEVVQSSVDEDSEEDIKNLNLEECRKTCATFISKTPEQFAQEHNLILDTSTKTDDCNRLAMAKDRVLFQQKSTSNTSLFSVNLGKMRTMRLFFSNPECTSGQLVIASAESQYKILHFHHNGLDKLAKLFEQWNAIKSKSVKDGSPSPILDRQLLICQPEVQRTELDPEEMIFDQVNYEFWKIHQNTDGSIDDSYTIRKAVYFASINPSLKKDIYPFLLRVYTWNSTFEQREAVRNDLFLEYNNIKRKRIQKMTSASKSTLLAIESTIWKDVVRTDRRNSYYAGENNPNLIVMKDILLNYAFVNPDVNYIQGMSDLLAPLLNIFRNESDSYFNFCGLMRQTLFCCPNSEMNEMEKNLEYLRNLLELLEPKFFTYLRSLGNEALQLMFVHRWLLLFFKREFPASDALHIWEACWCNYRTSHFHLFVAVAIVSIYGADVISQGLPHDEVLLYFSSLAMHMDASVVLKKARGLLYHFYRLKTIPCTLAGICEIDSTSEQWSSIAQPTFVCTKIHGMNEPCPFAVET
ncbi:TBC1 domain family member 16 [Aphelenchoides besseyi]|nr:TBC1 domain family member 16 [Aphelenchoides besseyi]KAI6201913.1 TBC1 domain family member 16 [Aphelenchoides besseyi]